MAFFGGYAGNGLRIGGEFDTHTDTTYLFSKISLFSLIFSIIYSLGAKLHNASNSSDSAIHCSGFQLGEV